jgi:hypothetical protein
MNGDYRPKVSQLVNDIRYLEKNKLLEGVSRS